MILLRNNFELITYLQTISRRNNSLVLNIIYPSSNMFLKIILSKLYSHNSQTCVFAAGKNRSISPVLQGTQCNLFIQIIGKRTCSEISFYFEKPTNCRPFYFYFHICQSNVQNNYCNIINNNYICISITCTLHIRTHNHTFFS